MWKMSRLFHEQLNQDVSRSSVKKTKVDIEEILRDYFQLGTSLKSLYRSWSERDELFKSVAPLFPGVRVLRQDPTECLFSFICSSCNNIKRVTQMIDNLCINYGHLLHNDDEFGPIHSFPTVETLSLPGVEEGLRRLGFGYRAKFIQSTAKQILDQQIDLLTFRTLDHNECHSALLTFTGIGSKVADCIALFSMDKVDAIPVDTHVYSIATRDYNLQSNSKSVTKKTYKLIGDFFRSKFPSHAGWAHSVLFAADLNMFKNIKSQVSSSEVGKKNQVSSSEVGKKNQVSSSEVGKKRERKEAVKKESNGKVKPE